MLIVKATPTFENRVAKLLGPEQREALIRFVGANPEAGDIVAGTGGVRKLRWAMPGQGKRGGARVLQLYLKHRGTVWLLDVYGKREKADLSPADARAVKALVDAIKASVT